MKKNKSTFKLNKQKVASLEAKTVKGGTGTSYDPTKLTHCYWCPQPTLESCRFICQDNTIIQ